MVKKQGITITMLVITIIILTILAGTITISVYSTIDYSKLSTWANEIMYIQDIVDEKLNTSSILTDTLDIVNINVKTLDSVQKEEQFSGETITNGNLVELRSLDLSKLGITDTMYGKQSENLDVYAISITTGRVYYAKGFEVGDTVYYTLTEGLKQRFELTSTANLNSVVFMPNKIGYTNEAVKVTVKVPQTFSNVAISTTNKDIQLSSQNVEENLYTYIVNTTDIVGNYTINVSYNDGVQTKTVSYVVSGYDTTKPIIQPITRDNWVYKETDKAKTEYIAGITATDESGIKVLKYVAENINEQDAKEYFKTNGNDVIDGKINLSNNLEVYTIYAEDNAGNYAITTINVTKLKGWVKQGFTVVKGNQVLGIGDIVNYESGVDGYIDENGWKVLGADEDGNLLIMSASDVKSSHPLGDETYFKDLEEAKNDWLNGAAELDGICEAYGYGEGAVGKARSITVEDINSVTGYNPETAAYGKGEVYEYGNEVTYAWDGDSKISYKGTKNSKAGSENYSYSAFTWYDEKTGTFPSVAKGVTTTPLPTLKSTCYNYNAPDLTTISATENPEAYQMIFGNDDTYYWLASPYVYASTNRALFGVFIVANGLVYYYDLWASTGFTNYFENGVRAVVTLPYNTNFTGSSEAGWSY